MTTGFFFFPDNPIFLSQFLKNREFMLIKFLKRLLDLLGRWYLFSPSSSSLYLLVGRILLLLKNLEDDKSWKFLNKLGSATSSPNFPEDFDWDA